MYINACVSTNIHYIDTNDFRPLETLFEDKVIQESTWGV